MCVSVDRFIGQSLVDVLRCSGRVKLGPWDGASECVVGSLVMVSGLSMV